MVDQVVSYAQNLEDVLLWRALKSHAPGFYVDVGANSPVVDSVTKMFYDRGWRGINVEPLSPWIDQLRVERPEDVNLAVCVSDSVGEVELLDVVDTGLSTTDLSKRSYYEEHFAVRVTTKPMVTLASILNEHPPTVEFHFLKVDVEGMEAKVLAGCDFTRHRPWIVVVESIDPESQVPNHSDWEPLLTTSSYEFLFFDGLNRFYAASERVDMVQSFFGYPAGVLDNYKKAAEVDALAELRRLQKEHAKILHDHHSLSQQSHAQQEELTEVHLRLQSVLEERTELEHELKQAENATECLQTSTSWTVTSPLRKAADAARLGTTKFQSKFSQYRDGRGPA